MEEVSCLLWEAFERSMPERGIDPATLIAGLPVTLEHLRRPTARIEWGVFAVLAQRFMDACGGREGLEAVGGGAVERRSLAITLLLNLGRGAGLLRTVELGARWLLPLLARNLRIDFERQRLDGLRVVVTIPETDAPCEALMVLIASGTRAMPAALGVDVSTFSWEATERRLDLRFTVARASDAWAKEQGEVVDQLIRQQEELRASEDALRRSEAGLRAILDALHDGVVISDEGVILYVNAAYCRLLGVAAATVEGTPLPEWMTVDAECDKRQLGVRTQASVIPFRGRQATLRVVTDLSSRQRERAIRDELLVNDRLASIGRLAAGVAHDMNNPLTYVLTNIEFARTSIARREPDLKAVGEALADAAQGTRRVRDIVADLRRLARADDSAAVEVDLRAIVAAALALAAPEARRRCLLESALGAAPRVRGTPAKLTQIVLNLIVHACQSFPQDSNPLGLVTVRLDEHEGFAVFEVSDNGPAVAPGTLARAFEPFAQADVVAPGGAGVGLAIAHTMAIAIGGSLEAQSDGVRGKTLTARLPLAGAGGKAAQPA